MKILYAEDEKSLSSAVTTILKIQNFKVDNAYDGQEALDKILSSNYDVCVLDIMMPTISGIEVLKIMRQHGNYTPVIMVTAKTTLEDRVDGLTCGADDYICKPFETKELIARINALIRRESNKYSAKNIKYKNVELNYSTNELVTENSTLVLNSKELKLLKLLIKNDDDKVTKDDIIEEVFDGVAQSSSVDLYISYLMDKLRQVKADFTITTSEDSYYID